MSIASSVLVAFVALEHVYILVLEMFLWSTPRGLKAFNMTPEKAETTAVLAKNQGLYNGFLAAGLAYSLVAADAHEAYGFKVFFLACVIVAGMYGGMTVGKKIFFIQAIPALVALATVLACGRA